MTLPELDLRGVADTTPRARGRAQGEAWRDAARELISRRVDQLAQLEAWTSPEALRRAGEATLAGARPEDAAAIEELEGMAEALERPAWALGVAGAFADLWDRGGGQGPAPGAARTTLYVVGHAPLLGQALLAGPDRAALGRLSYLAPDGAPVVLATLAGTLGVGGTRPGLLVAINHIRSRRGGPGSFMGLELRRALATRDAVGARAALAAGERGGGRFFLVSDGRELYGLESDGPSVVLTRKGARTAHAHTDHFFDPALRKVELGGPPRSSFRRTELVTSVYVQRRPEDPRALWRFLDEIDGLRGASGDEDEDRSIRHLHGSSALWVGRGDNGALWARNGLGPLDFPTMIDRP